ncbi:unnamed protein product [Brachionus calyciflorus]|uniref:U8 snoRNA-decapping enzyme n=1 Tax=Brachionus calyciflorus TaxID=104777 RepID=A0A813MQS9_9BILA|nr:unnamed protein product [Brachionus calyciflorus]
MVLLKLVKSTFSDVIPDLIKHSSNVTQWGLQRGTTILYIPYLPFNFFLEKNDLNSKQKNVISNISNLNKQTKMQATTKIVDNWKKVLNALKTNRNMGKLWSKAIEDHSEIDLEESKKLNDYRLAAHAFIWSKNDQSLWELSSKASIMMQMRFDGFIGFPGGLIDSTDASVVDGLNRELREEINLNEKYYITNENYFFSSVNHQRKIILHFYVKEVTQTELIGIEKAALDSHDYGTEVMGIIRPPLYDIKPGRGFNIFLQNQFVGNSLLQLLKTMSLLDILDNQTILKFIDSC